MVKFAYNNFKITSTGYIPFELNYDYYLRVLFEDEYNTYSRFFLVNKIAIKLKK